MKIRLLPYRTRAGWLALLAIPLAVAAAEGLGWWWMHPADDPGGVELLEYDFPGGRDGFDRRPVEEKVEDILHFDRGQTGLIEVGGGGMIDVHYFEWNDTAAIGLGDTFGHAPDACMGNAGLKVEQFLPDRTHRLGDTDLVFDATLFRDPAGAPLYIFKLAWAEGMAGVNLVRAAAGADSRKFKLKAVARRWRPGFARVMMLGVFGAANEEEAWKLARLYVLEDLRFVNPPRDP
jgi:hypothetical protein